MFGLWCKYFFFGRGYECVFGGCSEAGAVLLSATFRTLGIMLGPLNFLKLPDGP